MPLFGKKAAPQPEPTPAKRSSTLFGRKNTNNVNDVDNNNNANSSRSGSMFNRNNNNAGSISTARNKVSIAEKAEQDALRSLDTARNAVKHAKDHVTRLEKEADEDAKMAHAKQREAKSLRNDTKGLGRV
ncbi:hypothetical protein FRB96_008808 [Tulasnella sp. 330]|nr:hypothetical protein FRB96_008808 [Tulasnella sp. 330]KAG8870684.1 hypothetical protein FRB97_009468 [Tulasnella sp. 331]KAG8880725.1 hypothetical protein FRB98_004766 [Tulasnella sp. 332]